MLAPDPKLTEPTPRGSGTTAGHAPQDVARDGNRLIVPRGGDISGLCLCCGQASAGRITCHLRRANGGVFHKSTGSSSGSSLLLILDLLELVLFCLMFVTDLPASRKRKLTYGLCAKHLSKRRWMRTSAPVVFLLGVVLLGYMFTHTSAPAYIGIPAAIVGIGSIAGGPMLYFMSPRPSLAGENPQYLWLKGAGKALLDQYPQQKKSTPNV